MRLGYSGPNITQKFVFSERFDLIFNESNLPFLKTFLLKIRSKRSLKIDQDSRLFFFFFFLAVSRSVLSACLSLRPGARQMR